jgi:hypothetical protein
MRPKSLGTVASNGPILPALDGRWVWNICGMINGRRKWSAQRKTSVPLSTINPTWTILGLNLGLYHDKPVTYHSLNTIQLFGSRNNQECNTANTEACHCTQHWAAGLIPSQPTSFTFHLGIPGRFFQQCFFTKILVIFLASSTCTSCLTHSKLRITGFLLFVYSPVF